MENERKDVVTSRGTPKTLLGEEIRTGDIAPNFTVLNQGFESFELKTLSGKIRLISVVPSLDTGVCDMQTRRFNEEAANLGDDVEIITISVDLPFAQKRWCGAAGIDQVKVLSDHRDLDFGYKYGVVIKELRLLSRSIFIIDKDDKVRYVEYVREITDHPDYDEALNVIRSLI